MAVMTGASYEIDLGKQMLLQFDGKARGTGVAGRLQEAPQGHSPFAQTVNNAIAGSKAEIVSSLGDCLSGSGSC